ncbi:MAG: acyloxyacyl hydrolase [Bacteroidales bacterium]
MKSLFKIILVVIFNNPLFSQSSWLFTSSIRYGFLFPHRPSLSYFNNRHINEITFEVSKQLSDTNKWYKLYRFPNFGGGLYYAKLPSSLYTGKAIATYGFIDIPIKWNKNHSLNYSIASGIAYLTKHFNRNDNYYNIAIGSSLNAFINFGIHYCLYFKKLQINTGISFTHYSNGALKKPNLGFNIPSLKISVGYLSKPKDFYYPKTQYKNNKHSTNEYDIMLSFGFRQNFPSDPNTYLVNNLAFTYERQISIKRKLGIGIDLFYDPSIPVREQSIPNFNKYYPYFRNGLRLSHDLIFNNLSITVQAGGYLYDPLMSDGLIYSKIGIRYNINSWLRANILLKSHFAKADIIEFGLSFYKQKGA